VLGRGAMGLVLGARHVFLDRAVAIKVLHPTLLLVDETRERFLREARAASQVDDETVVSVTDFGVTPEGLHYLVMEYLEGADLYAYTGAYGAVSARTAAHIGVQICDALIAIHDAGWVHRDLKPENIWVMAGSPPEAPTVKVIDLGIAAVMDEARTGVDGARLTRTGHTVGTVHYMSPEQALGEEVDGRSDLYSLGCILWELVTGECTFEGTSQMAVMMKHMSEAAQPPSSRNPRVPKWFDTVALRCLSKRKEHRFLSARDCREALKAGLESEPADRMPETMESRVVARKAPAPTFAETGTANALVLPRQRRWPLLVAIALIVAGIVVWQVSASDGEPAGLAPPVADAPVVTPAENAAGAETGEPEVPTVAGTPADGVLGEAEAEPRADDAAVAAGADTAAEDGAPAAPSLVVLRFDVKPDGAVVSRDGQALGKTPLTVEVPRSEDEHTYTIAHPRRETRTITLTHDRDVTIARRLAARHRPATGRVVKDRPEAVETDSPGDQTTTSDNAKPVATDAPGATTKPVDDSTTTNGSGGAKTDGGMKPGGDASDDDPPTGLMRPSLPGAGGG